MNFKRKNQNELSNLKDDEKLITYAVDARDAGDIAAFEQAIRVFVGRRMGMVSFWVSKKASGEDADEIIGNALASMVKSAGKIKGASVGEVVEWMRTITAHRITDFYRAKAKVPDTLPIDTWSDDDSDWNLEPGEDPDETGAVEIRILFENALGKLDEAKREVVKLKIQGYPSKEIAEMSSAEGMTATNVDKIFSRFKQELSKEIWDD